MTEASKQPGRADFLLTIAIAVVAALVLALVLVLGAGAQLYADARKERLSMRGSRDALIEFTARRTDAIEAQRTFLISGDSRYLSNFTQAKSGALTALTHVRRFNAGDLQWAAGVSRLETSVQALFANLDASVSTRRENGASAARTVQLSEMLERETAAMHAAIVTRSDALLETEGEARRRIDSLAGLLAMLSLVTSALAILALRRERQQWRLATEAAEEARARAAASDLAKTRFLAVASHDMRQPLHALTLYLSALERRVEGAEARDIVAKMDRATQSMVGMFATLLDLARVQAGVVKAEIGEVRLQDVLDRIVAEHPGRGIETAYTPFLIRTDPVLLEQMLRNLVSNALKHGGGKVRIEVTGANGEVEITVADDGPGIPLEDQDRIFEEFVRLEGRAEGLGLGLAIVKRIALLLDMPLKVQSAPGEGARFLLRAPLVGVEAAQPAAAAAGDVSLGGAQVLIVDDDPLAREAVTRMMSDLGAATRSAANEDDAVALLDSGFAPRLLVMDLRIDGALVGVDIGQRLRARFDPAPPVIVITGDTGPETLALLRASGFPWLIKPVKPSDLSAAAAAQLRSQSVSAT